MAAFAWTRGNTAWYNRNLRIFSNLQRAIPAPGQRVFVLIGAGHVPILSHLVGSSPELELVPVDRYLRAR